MGQINILSTDGTHKAGLSFTGTSDISVDAGNILQSTDSIANIANGKILVNSDGSTTITGAGNTLSLSKANNIPALKFKGQTDGVVIEGSDTGLKTYINGTEQVTIDVNGGVHFKKASVKLLGGSNYNENIRMMPGSSDYSSIAFGATSSDSGTCEGQWTLARFPLAGFNQKFAIRHNAIDMLEISKSGVFTFANSTNTYAANLWSTPPVAGMANASYISVDHLNIQSMRTTLDRQWNNEPSITIRNDTTNGSQANFRIHGINGVSGGDYSVVVVSDGGYASSDRRRKTDIKNIENPLDTVKKLQGRQFKYVNSELKPQVQMSKDNGNKFGFIAQEIEDIIPQAVKVIEGEVSIENEVGYADGYAVDYSSLTALLVEAVKEQQEMIEDLQKEIKLLKENKW